MGGTLILGCVMMAACVAIQCVVVSILLRALLVLERRQTIRPTLGYGDVVMSERGRLLGALEAVVAAHASRVGTHEATDRQPQMVLSVGG